MSNPLTADDLYKSLGLSTEPDKVKAEKKQPAKSKFLTNQYVLFSTPILIIYLQGVLPSVANSPESDQIRVAFEQAKKRKLTTGRAEAQLAMADYLVNGGYKLLYTNPEEHKRLLGKMIELGLSLQVDKVASRTAVTATINKYLDDLANFLATYGYSSPEDYLIKTSKEANELSSADMLAALDDL